MLEVHSGTAVCLWDTDVSTQASSSVIETSPARGCLSKDSKGKSKGSCAKAPAMASAPAGRRPMPINALRQDLP